MNLSTHPSMDVSGLGKNIRNKNSSGVGFPFFEETEKNNEIFTYKNVPVNKISKNSKEKTTIPVFFIEKKTEMMGDLKEIGFKEIEVAELELSFSGTGNRR